jgi:hypothetical protein
MTTGYQYDDKAMLLPSSEAKSRITDNLAIVLYNQTAPSGNFQVGHYHYLATRLIGVIFDEMGVEVSDLTQHPAIAPIAEIVSRKLRYAPTRGLPETTCNLLAKHVLQAFLDALSKEVTR